MKFKKVLLIILAVSIPVLAGLHYYMAEKIEAPQSYIFDKTSEVGLKEVEASRQKVDFTGGGSQDSDAGPFDIREYFRDNIVGDRTLKYFKHLEMRFKDFKSLEDHFAAVYKYLKLQLPAEDAERLFEMYKKYLKCEIDLAELIKKWGAPVSAEQMLSLLARAQEYRRDVLGDELADNLFEAGVKSKEYAVRRSMIALDSDLYGKEKEALIDELNEDMWGDEADTVGNYPKPYTQYREKLALYRKDMSEMASQEEKDSLIKSFRENIFPEEVVARLEAVDTKMREDKAKEEEYRIEEAAVIENSGLSDNEKEARIRALQSRHFEDPEAFRRLENKRKALEKYKKGDQ